MTERVEDSFAHMAQAMGDGPGAEQAAVAAWCTMVGALALARTFRGQKRADEILKHARQSILDLEARVRTRATLG
jgi:TetR/AcrR family transcriptional repressor of nem operon